MAAPITGLRSNPGSCTQTFFPPHHIHDATATTLISLPVVDEARLGGGAQQCNVSRADYIMSQSQPTRTAGSGQARHSTTANHQTISFFLSFFLYGQMNITFSSTPCSAHCSFSLSLSDSEFGSGVPRNFFSGGGVSTNSVEDRGQRERGSGDVAT